MIDGDNSSIELPRLSSGSKEFTTWPGFTSTRSSVALESASPPPLWPAADSAKAAPGSAESAAAPAVRVRNLRRDIPGWLAMPSSFFIEECSIRNHGRRGCKPTGDMIEIASCSKGVTTLFWRVISDNQALFWNFHPQLRSPLGRVGVELFNHLRSPAAVDLPRAVLLLSQHHKPPVIHQVVHLRVVRHLPHQLRRDKRDSFRIAHRHIARHDGCLPHPDRHVDSHQRHVP